MRDLGSVCMRCQLRLLVAPVGRHRALGPRQSLRYNSSRTALDDVQPQHNHAPPILSPSSARPANPRPSPASGSSSAAAAAAAARRATAVAMFKSIVGAPAAELSKTSIEDTSDGIELIQEVSKMQSMIGDQESPTKIYNYFIENVYPLIQKLGADVSRSVTEKIGAILTTKLVQEKVNDFDTGDLPSVTRLTDIMIELNVLSPSAWGKLILQLLQHICRLDVSPENYDSIQSYETAMSHRDGLIRDLLGAWSSFVAHKPAAQPVADSVEAQDAPAEAVKALPHRGPHHVQAFADVFHQYTLGILPRPTWAAYATYRLLQDPVNLNRSFEQEAAPFMNLMKQIISRTSPPKLLHYEKEFSPYPELLSYFLRLSDTPKTGKPRTTGPTPINRRNHTVISNHVESRDQGDLTSPTDDSSNPTGIPDAYHTTSTDDTNIKPPTDSAPDPTSTHNTNRINTLNQRDTKPLAADAPKPRMRSRSTIHKNTGIKTQRIPTVVQEQMRRDRLQRQLTQAIKLRNLTAARKVWGDFWGPDEVPGPTRVAEMVEHKAMFNYFILAYMTMRRPSLAIEVWDKMTSIGIQPTIETWNSMMQGCAQSKNPDGIKAVWQKLITSGITLDTTIWTARISGLFNSGDPDGALKALNEMAIVWNQRNLPENANIAVQPSIEPVNAALAGLFRCGRDDDARRVLTWAASYNINPDIFTFNTLLGPLVRRGDHTGVEGIFNTMRRLKIDADVTTFTVMLEATLAHVGTRDPAEQVAIVKHIITEMNAAGIDANMHTYAKMIYLLLREGEGSSKAVQAVLGHIWASGQELTSQIYTMLVDHYFAQDPPDIEAVTSLIDRRLLKNNRDIDRIFWDRVIRGYSANGETYRALEIFQNVVLPAGITSITFATLYELLYGLQEIQAWDAAAELVDYAAGVPDDELDDLAGGVAFAARDKGFLRTYKHRFWHLASQLGLLRGEALKKFRASLSKLY